MRIESKKSLTDLPQGEREREKKSAKCQFVNFFFVPKEIEKNGEYHHTVHTISLAFDGMEPTPN